MAKRWGAETFFLPEIWQEFARPGYSVVPGDPSGPDGIIDGTQPRRNDLRSITHRLKKFDFVFVLRSDDTHYWLDWHIWRAGATAAESVLVSGHEANIDRLKIEIADAMRKRDDLGLDDLVWEFEIFWTTKEKHTDFTGTKVIQGDYIIYAANGGRSAILKYGRVTKLTYSTANSHRTNVADCAVQAVTMDNWDKEVQSNGKPVTLTFMSRIVAVQNIPQPFRDKLDAAYYAAMEQK